ncbi:uncharacterized protein EI97DRAFT_431507 [Westerdykella ornata]|uniref:DUF3431 domain-containing protein n=1 Tax=Westerdykella ornata TaxID=318751 RepID=A0A6A6JRB2_WESOR|nr:uncharacterized protein EI97DRAFT_431507 [Westerdykella ornata]KAF2278246.1 hypothetical protein EI97DRAFT_431507 [Westerdykella ornata]
MRAIKGPVATVAAIAAIAILLFCSLNWRHGTSDTDWKADFAVESQEDIKKPSSGGYPYIKPDPLPWKAPTPKSSNSSTVDTASPADRVIVLATLEHDDNSQVHAQFPGWQLSFQILGRDFAKLHAGADRTDKGRIANAYLTFIIENYHNLPETMVFLNSYPSNTQNSANLNKVDAVRNLKTDYIQKAGYANLRCMTKAGCTNHFLPTRNPPDEFRTLEVAMANVWNELFRNDNLPEKLATPCCAEFAVSREQVQKKGVAEYLRYWEWLNKTKMDDDTAGLVFEYIWHIIFGREAEYCLELEKCECDLYGRC